VKKVGCHIYRPYPVQFMPVDMPKRLTIPTHSAEFLPVLAAR